MIERFYLRNNFSFEKVDLEFQNGLILFTGSSGAGKSVLLNAILSTIGQKEVYSEIAEVTFDRTLNLEEFGIDSDEITVFKQMKKGRLRFFINSQNIPKKSVSEIGKLFITHLNPREVVEFESEYILEILDSMGNYRDLINSYKSEFEKYENLKYKISKIESDISILSEREDFVKFEIERIEKVAPEDGEDEELQLTKKRLSKKEKIEEYISESETIFEKRRTVLEVFDLMGFEKEVSEIEDFFEHLKARFEEIIDELSELDEFDVEELLDRIEKISDLKTKYGSIHEALLYVEERKLELQKVSELRKELVELELEKEAISAELQQLGLEISEKRKEQSPNFRKNLDENLELLNLGVSQLYNKRVSFHKNGIDFISLSIENTPVLKLSYGEQNRVRLAILTLKTVFGNGSGTLFLDEVDANLSGDESMRVAKVLKKLSKGYQIFAISHQPQLTSQADQHFVVFKNSGKSGVIELDSKKSRAEEIARMVGGNFEEANNFAMKLLEL
jgi:DNA repair protein RecN (Recombination protein N)